MCYIMNVDECATQQIINLKNIDKRYLKDIFMKGRHK